MAEPLSKSKSEAPHMATAAVERRHIDRTTHVTTQQQEMDHFMALANEARRDYEDAAREYRGLVDREGELEAERPVILAGIKAELMALNSGLAATNAEKQAHIEDRYLLHLSVQRGTVRQKDDARTRMVSAVLRCKTSIAALKNVAGLI